jgi:hypothetical protein
MTAVNSWWTYYVYRAMSCFERGKSDAAKERLNDAYEKLQEEFAVVPSDEFEDETEQLLEGIESPVAQTPNLASDAHLSREPADEDDDVEEYSYHPEPSVGSSFGKVGLEGGLDDTFESESSTEKSRKPCGEYHPLPCGLDVECPDSESSESECVGTVTLDPFETEGQGLLSVLREYYRVERDTVHGDGNITVALYEGRADD